MQPGAVIAEDYRLETLLGEGAFAQVWSAQDQNLGRSVAIKILKPHAAAFASIRERFLQEGRILASLDDPGVVKVLRWIETPTALVMERIAGESLLAWMRRVPVDQRSLVRCVAWSEQLARALTLLHERGVQHRDIKPSNILLREPTQAPVLIDFGVAYSPRTEGRLSVSGQSIGTPGFMSPEQAAGTLELDGRTDIFSLGAVLYELLTGSLPFPGDSGPELLAATLSWRFTPLSVRAGQTIPPALARAVDRALARDPADRYPEITAFAQALNDALTPTLAPLSLDFPPLDPATSPAAETYLLPQPPPASAKREAAALPTSPLPPPDAQPRPKPSLGWLLATLPACLLAGAGAGWFWNLDRDGDGLTDREDTCVDLAGPAALGGCPDGDGDGYSDASDPCPDRYGPEGGCPDADGDGSLDDIDLCPEQAGPAATRGCPNADGDDALGSEDRCLEVAGSLHGCPDPDGDHLIADDDICPNEAGPKRFMGCPTWSWAPDWGGASLLRTTGELLAISWEGGAISWLPFEAPALAYSISPLPTTVRDLSLSPQGATLLVLDDAPASFFSAVGAPPIEAARALAGCMLGGDPPRLALASESGGLRIYDEAGALDIDLHYPREVLQFACVPGHEELLLGEAMKEIVRSGQTTERFAGGGHHFSVAQRRSVRQARCMESESVQISVDTTGEHFAVVCATGEVLAWRRGETARVLTDLDPSGLLSVDWASDHWIVTRSDSVEALAGWRRTPTAGRYTAVAVAGDRLALGTSRGQVELFDSSGALLARRSLLRGAITSLVISASGETLSAGGEAGLTLWALSAI